MAYDEKPTEKLNDEEKLERFHSWLRLATDAEAEQRRREEEDLAFQVAENQWPDEARKARSGRPMLSISLLHQPMQLVQNQAASAHLGVELHPVSEDADKELAEIKQGLYQRIQRDGMANQARLWAFDRAKQCGRGWYRITTQVDEDSDNPTDQEIVYERILHQEMVYPDPAAQKPDYSDGRFIIVAGYMPLETFREMYPKAADDHTSDTLEGIRETAPEWVQAGGDRCDPLVAEVFYKKTKTVEMEAGGAKVMARRTYVCRAVVTGAQIVEDEPWLAPQDQPEQGRRYFPIVPVIGRELQPIKGKRRFEGMVRPARDGQMFHNYAASSLVEAMALEPKAPFIVEKRAIEGYEQYWDTANLKNWPYLPYNGVSDNGGQPLPPPQRQQVDGSRMQLAAMAISQGKDFVQAATAVYEPALGEVSKRKDAQSGRAIMALQQQTDAGTSHYLTNLKDISLPLDARIVMDMIPVVYDRPGRVTQILGAEDKPRPVMLGKPFVPGPDGRPKAAPMMAGPGGQMVPADPNAKSYDLSKGRYAIVATIGKSPQTRLQQGQEFLTSVVEAVPELTSIIGDVIFRFRDEPGAKEIAERLEKKIRAEHPQLFEKGDGSIQELQAKAAALEQQLGMMQQELQKAADIIKTEQVKQQAQVEVAKLKAQVDMGKAQLEAETRMRIAEIGAAQKVADGSSKATEGNRERQHETVEGVMDRHHERVMQHEKLAHEAAMGAATGRTMTFSNERGQDEAEERERSHGSESLPPPPAGEGA